MPDRERDYELLPFYRIAPAMRLDAQRKTGSSLKELSPNLDSDIASYIASANAVPQRIIAAGMRDNVDMRWTAQLRYSFARLSDMLRTYSVDVLANPYYRNLSQRYPAGIWPLLVRWNLGRDERYDQVARLESDITALSVHTATASCTGTMQRFLMALQYPQGMLEAISQHLLLPKIGLGDDFATDDERVRSIALLKRNSADIDRSCRPCQETILSTLHGELIGLARKQSGKLKQTRVRT